MFSSWCLKAIHLSRVLFSRSLSLSFESLAIASSRSFSLLLFADHCLNILFIKVNILPFKNVRVTKIRKMAQTVRAAGIFNGHKVSHSNRGLTRLPQSGAGLGDLLRGFIRWIIPAGKTLIKEGAEVAKKAAKTKLVKNAARALKRDAINAGIDLAQTALKRGDVKAGLRSNATKVIDGLSQSVSSSLKDYRPPAKKKKNTLRSGRQKNRNITILIMCGKREN